MRDITTVMDTRINSPSFKVKSVAESREKTLAIIKPDAVKNSNVGDIKNLATDHFGFTILLEDTILLSRHIAEEFYDEHLGKLYFDDLITFMTSGPIHVMILEKAEAIESWRKAMGPQERNNWEINPRSLRALFGTDDIMNAVHGSSCPFSARREIKFFFPGFQLFPLPKIHDCKEYIKNNLQPTLVKCLTSLAKEKPSAEKFEALTFIAHWLLQHNPNNPRIVPGHELAHYKTLEEDQEFEFSFYEREVGAWNIGFNSTDTIMTIMKHIKPVPESNPATGQLQDSFFNRFGDSRRNMYETSKIEPKQGMSGNLQRDAPGGNDMPKQNISQPMGDQQNARQGKRTSRKRTQPKVTKSDQPLSRKANKMISAKKKRTQEAISRVQQAHKKQADMSIDVFTCIRQRPILTEEDRHDCVVDLEISEQRVLLWPRRKCAEGVWRRDNCTTLAQMPKPYEDHTVLQENASNDSVFDHVGRDLIKQAIQRNMNVVVIAFGQSGSGKTYTLGTSDQSDDPEWTPGFAQKAIECFMETVNERQCKEQRSGLPDASYAISCSAYEVWLGQVYDLLTTSESERNQPLSLVMQKHDKSLHDDVRYETVACRIPRREVTKKSYQEINKLRLDEIDRQIEQGVLPRRIKSPPLNLGESHSSRPTSATANLGESQQAKSADRLVTREVERPEDLKNALQEALQHRAVDARTAGGSYFYRDRASTTTETETRPMTDFSQTHLSSRSHFVFKMTVSERICSSDTSDTRKQNTMCSVTLVDLAGSEHGSVSEQNDAESRQSKHQERLDRVKERGLHKNMRDVTTDIKMSLNSLIQCIQRASTTSRSNKSKGSCPPSYRDHALTRMLEPSLKGAKILMLGTIHAAAEHQPITAATLQYLNKAKKIKNNSDAKKLISLEAIKQQMHGIKFVRLSFVETFAKLEKQQPRQLVRYDKVEEQTAHIPLVRIPQKTLRIFVSHTWMSPFYEKAEDEKIRTGATWWRNRNEGHPDAAGHPKCNLVCKCLERMKEQNWISPNDVAIWYDFGCLDQDNNKQNVELDTQCVEVIANCDLLLTVVHDPDWQKWDKEFDEKKIMDSHPFECYNADEWKRYRTRCWCLLEAFLGANIRVRHKTKEERAHVLRGEWANMSGEMSRPHLLYGTRELEKRLDPIILPRLPEETFKKYHPAEGEITKDSDRQIIRAHVDALTEINEVDLNKASQYPLHYAIKAGRGVKAIEERRKDNLRAPWEPDEDGKLPLHLAIQVNSPIQVVQMLLDDNPEAVLKPDLNGHLPLHIAAMNETSKELIELLLKDNNGSTAAQIPAGGQERLPLHLAAISKRLSIPAIKILIDAHPEALHTQDKGGDLPFHHAVKGQQSSAAFVRLLLQRNQNAVQETGRGGCLPLHCAVGTKAPKKVVEMLIEAFPDAVHKPVGEHINGMYPLHLASKSYCKPKPKNGSIIDEERTAGDETEAKAIFDILLKDKGKNWAMVRARSQSCLPLHMAAQNNLYPDAMSALIASFPEALMQRNKSGDLPLHLAIKSHALPEVIITLLRAREETATIKGSKGRHLWQMDENGCPSSNPRNKSFSKYLFDEFGLKASKGGRLPLHHAAEEKSSIDVFEDLIKANPKALLEGDEGRRLPLHLYMATPGEISINVIKLLAADEGKAASRPDEFGFLPVHWAVRHPQIHTKAGLEAIQFLLDKYPRARHDKRNKAKKRPWDLLASAPGKQSSEILDLHSALVALLDPGNQAVS